MGVDVSRKKSVRGGKHRGRSTGRAIDEMPVRVGFLRSTASDQRSSPNSNARRRTALLMGQQPTDAPVSATSASAKPQRANPSYSSPYDGDETIESYYY